MIRIFHILFKSFIDLFRPRFLVLLLLPPVAALLFWGGLAYYFWDQLLIFSQAFGGRFLFTQEIPAWALEWFSVTPEKVTTFLAGFMAVILILPLTFLTSMLVTSILVMPTVIKFLALSFPSLERKGSSLLVASTQNLIKSSVIYLSLWVLTLPLWAIPGMSIAVPLLLNGYLNYRLFVFDALGEYATLSEIQQLQKRKRVDFLLLGVIISLLVLFPPFFLILPIYGALCFTRYALLELQDLRKRTPMPA